MNRHPILDAALVALMMTLIGLAAGAGVVGLGALAITVHGLALMGALPALICGGLFLAHYLIFRTCPPHLGAAAGYAVSALWLFEMFGEAEPALIFALPGAVGGYVAAAMGRRMLIALGRPA